MTTGASPHQRRGVMDFLRICFSATVIEGVRHDGDRLHDLHDRSGGTPAAGMSEGRWHAARSSWPTSLR